MATKSKSQRPEQPMTSKVLTDCGEVSIFANYVGIDPSYSGTGLVHIVVDDKGEITDTIGYEFKAGTSDMDFVDRVKDLLSKILKVLPSPQNTTIFMEGAAYAAEFNAFMLGELSGGIKLGLSERGHKINIVAPNILKKFATGSGAAQKTYVAAMVAKKWGFVHPSNNVSDAYVLAKMAHEHWTPEPKESKSKGSKKSTRSRSKRSTTE